MDDFEIVECLLALTDKESCFLPFEHEGFNPLDLESIKEEQQKDEDLQRLAEKYPNEYFPMSMGRNLNILVHVKPGLDKQTQWKICLPETMVKDAIKWYHVALGHPGSERTKKTIQARYHGKHISRECAKFKCEHCKKYKTDPKQWGLLPERKVTTELFSEIAVNLIGPWKIPVGNRVVKFNALTIIDMASNLVELTRIKNKKIRTRGKKIRRNLVSSISQSRQMYP